MVRRRRTSSTPSARSLFQQQYKGKKNFMSPNVIKYGKANKNVAYEISSGRGFENDTIYGVTFVSRKKRGKTHPLYAYSKPFNTRSDAERYVQRVKKKFSGYEKKKNRKVRTYRKQRKAIYSGFLPRF